VVPSGSALTLFDEPSDDAGHLMKGARPADVLALRAQPPRANDPNRHLMELRTELDVRPRGARPAMHGEQFSTLHLVRLVSGITAKETVMPDRRRVVAKANIAAGAYLHPNFYVGDQDKKMWQMQSDAPIADIDANFLESWMWAKHPSLAAALENSIFEAFEDTTIA